MGLGGTPIACDPPPRTASSLRCLPQDGQHLSGLPFHVWRLKNRGFWKPGRVFGRLLPARKRCSGESVGIVGQKKASTSKAWRPVYRRAGSEVNRSNQIAMASNMILSVVLAEDQRRKRRQPIRVLPIQRTLTGSEMHGVRTQHRKEK